MGSCKNWIIRSRTRCKGFLRQGHERKRSSLGDASLCMDTIWPEAQSRQLRTEEPKEASWKLESALNTMVHPPAPESVDPESLAFPSALWETPAQSPRFNL